MKDNFSSQSDQYAKCRPTYPVAFFEYLNAMVPHKQAAWDCGTGNGQVAAELANTFEQVFGTDISQPQLSQAAQAANITYSVQPAEKTDFADGQFDLVTVAQAIHWFDFDAFYAEVRRTAKADALLCLLGYGNVKVSDTIDPIIHHFYKDITGPYWDKERRYIDEGYQTIPFPFAELPAPAFVNTVHWTLDHFMGYLNTWSGLQHFIRQKGYNPIEQLQPELEPLWAEGETKAVHFPILLRLGRVHVSA